SRRLARPAPRITGHDAGAAPASPYRWRLHRPGTGRDSEDPENDAEFSCVPPAQNVEDPRPGALSLVKALQIIFLVGRMDAVIVAGKADQQTIHVQQFLEITDDRNRAAHADTHGRTFPFLRQGLHGEPDPWRIGIELDCARGAVFGKGNRAIGREALPDEFPEGGADAMRILAVHQAEGNLR